MYFSWDTEKPEPARVKKRLIICCDGTWQSSVTLKKNIPSNVTRLARSFAREHVEDDDKTVWEQVVYYDAGIGTGDISKAEADRQGGFGHGFTANVIEAYNFLALNWYPGDKVYCFGFSRGAYTARAVAGLVNDVGIISPRDMQDFPELYTEYIKYQGHNSHSFRKSSQYRKWQMGSKSSKGKDETTKLELFDKIPHCFVREESRLVEVVGVFDTVGSLGVPDSPYYTVDALMAGMNKWWGGESPGLHNVNLSPYIRHAYHALALDEHRAPFSPTLWHQVKDHDDEGVDHEHLRFTPEQHEEAIEAARMEFEKIYFDKPKFEKEDSEAEKQYEAKLDTAWAKIAECQTAKLVHRLDKPFLQQVWFPGMHINIGGGNDDPLKDWLSDFEQIALISFAWMCEQLKPHLKFEDRLRKRSVRDRLALIIPVKAEIAEGRNQDFGNYAITKPFWKALNWTGAYAAPRKDIASETVCGWAVGPIPDSYTGSMVATGSLTRSPGEYCHNPNDKSENPKVLGPTWEYIHPTVAYRMKTVPGYNPPALAGFKRTCNHGDWEWKKVTETGKEVKVPEFEIPADAKFSRFLARDYVKYMAQAEQMGTLKKVQNKKTTSDKPGTPPTTPPMQPDAPATDASAFLDATDRGVEWDKPTRKP